MMRVMCMCCKRKIYRKDGIKVLVSYDPEYKLEISKYYCSQECKAKDENKGGNEYERM